MRALAGLVLVASLAVQAQALDERERAAATMQTILAAEDKAREEAKAREARRIAAAHRAAQPETALAPDWAASYVALGLFGLAAFAVIRHLRNKSGTGDRK